QPSGWFGPWELTTWGQLILEVVANPDLPLEDLPDTPKERGARNTGLYYFTTSLDAWGSQGARPKQKVGEFIVTSENWHRDRYYRFQVLWLIGQTRPLTLAPPRGYKWL
ncbi:hypothetical protein AMECASPLE_039704, partial [Ameca splendens]